jgi:hypothetical protein
MIDFKDLKVWRKAHQMTLNPYRANRWISERRDEWAHKPASSARGSAGEPEYHFMLVRDLHAGAGSAFAG